MEALLMTSIYISFAGFILGLAGKAWAVNRKSQRKSDFFSRVTVLFLILMFLLVVFHRILI